MHELALMESLVSAVGERVGEGRVLRVRLEVGQHTCVLPDALSFCFDVCTPGTLLEGAELVIDRIAARGRCNSCGNEQPVDALYSLCACGSADLTMLTGQELRIREVEVI